MKRALFFSNQNSSQIKCELCPRNCVLNPGQRGFCYVRKNIDGDMFLTTYGKNSGLTIDPIEKKPLNHFLPGSHILSFGTPGCNLACKHCQNSELSRAREESSYTRAYTPEDIANAAKQHSCHSVAFTYNDPVVFCEYAVDTAVASHAKGIKTVAVTAGYITDEARPYFFSAMDAANVDLKSIRPEFYRKTSSGQLEPVLETLRYLKHQTQVWFEITNLLIPGLNDSPEDIKALCHWVLVELGPDVPIHFTAFHPAYKLAHIPRTPDSTLLLARKTALNEGIHYVYLGNCNIPGASDTICPQCGHLFLQRSGYHVVAEPSVKKGACKKCGTSIPGSWA